MRNLPNAADQRLQQLDHSRDDEGERRGLIAFSITCLGLAVSRFTTPELMAPLTLVNDDAPLFDYPAKRPSRMDWVLLAVAAAALPHYAHVPVWFMVILGAVLLVQSSRVRHRLRLSARTQRNLLLVIMLAGLVGTLTQFRAIWGLDAGIVLLIACLAGKLLEFESRRDAYVLLSLSLFLVGGLFLFDQGLQTTLLALFALVLNLLAMLMLNDLPDQVQVEHEPTVKTGFLSPPKPPIRTQLRAPHQFAHQVNLHDEEQHPLRRERLRRLLMLTGQALPLLVLLFVFFPRLPPMWSLHIEKNGAKTGMSDSMSPGDFARLSQSAELAFRVIFPNQDRPARSELYWRGLVFDQFDGRTWRSGQAPWLTQTAVVGRPAPKWALETGLVKRAQQPLRQYQLILEPTDQPWLYGLDVPLVIPKAKQAVVGLTPEGTLSAIQPVTQRQTYQLLQLDTASTAYLPARWLSQYLSLPAGNDQTRQFALQLWQQAGQDPNRYSQAVLAWIRYSGFAYTLEPPTLNGNRIDQFLFSTKRGFCEHYASAYTFLRRAVGIPARVVGGYQGGTLSPDGNSWEVRQMDAHAWTEIWLAGRGWVRIDPTAAIAPERVEQGMNALTQQSQQLFGDGAAGQWQQSQFQMFYNLRRWADYAGYLWQSNVVGFDQDKQGKFLQKLGIRSLMVQLLILFGLIAAIVGAIAFWLWWRSRPVWHPVDRPLAQLSQHLQKSGWQRRAGEGWLHWLERLKQIRPDPETHQLLDRLKADYQRARYAPDTTSHANAPHALRQHVQQLRHRFKSGSIGLHESKAAQNAGTQA